MSCAWSLAETNEDLLSDTLTEELIGKEILPTHAKLSKYYSFKTAPNKNTFLMFNIEDRYLSFGPKILICEVNPK